MKFVDLYIKNNKDFEILGVYERNELIILKKI